MLAISSGLGATSFSVVGISRFECGLLRVDVKGGTHPKVQLHSASLARDSSERVCTGAMITDGCTVPGACAASEVREQQEDRA